MGVPYDLRPPLGTDAFVTTTKKRKANASGKTVVKKAKVASVKTISVVKVVQPKSRPKLRSMFEIELLW
jgi:hypothetical protein